MIWEREEGLSSSQGVYLSNVPGAGNSRSAGEGVGIAQTVGTAEVWEMLLSHTGPRSAAAAQDCLLPHHLCLVEKVCT